MIAEVGHGLLLTLVVLLIGVPLTIWLIGATLGGILKALFNITLKDWARL